MKDGFVRVAAGTPAVKVADCPQNAREIIALMRQAYDLFGKEFTRWLRRGGTLRDRPFRVKLKTNLLVNG